MVTVEEPSIERNVKEGWSLPALAPKLKPPRLMLAIRSIALSQVRPFHDDQKLQDFICDAVVRHGIATFVETGTFRGDSLRWLASHYPNVKCVSAELSRPYFAYSKFRSLPMRNVAVYREDSRSFLSGVRSKVRDPVLLWLDAHGRGDWPLLGELRIVRRLYTKSLVLIDDFQVPGRPGFTYQTYGGRPLNLEYLKGELDGDCEVWVPDYEPQGRISGVCAIYFGLKGTESRGFRRILGPS